MAVAPESSRAKRERMAYMTVILALELSVELGSQRQAMT